MIEFDKFTLNNGLRVIVHKDHTTPLAAVNILYDVGARDENPQRTGFAHLFEHLMFGGSVNIPNYDEPLQIVGGDNNAWTNNDVTNYYLTLPKENLETAFWLESDRMLSLEFTEKSLEVQRNVVIEEFKQRYLNQPYGDVWLLLRPMAYKHHPYRWATIGQCVEHIEKATLEEVKEFFYSHYAPNNAILVVSGNVDTQQVRELANKWFGPIPKREIAVRELCQEPPQTQMRKLKVERNVPFDAIYMAFHMDKRADSSFYSIDLLSDILSNGQSSRLYQSLVKDKNIFTQIDAYITGDFDPGMFLVTGKLVEGISMEEAEEAIWKELRSVSEKKVGQYELQKVKNKVESSLVFSEISFLNKAMNLATHELLGDANNINREVEKYRSVTRENIQEYSLEIFRKENCSTLYYHSKK